MRLERCSQALGQLTFHQRGVMRRKLYHERAVRRHLSSQGRVGSDSGLHRLALVARELAVGIGRYLFGCGDHAASPIICISASRPRTSRELSVPTGQPTISAASL